MGAERKHRTVISLAMVIVRMVFYHVIAPNEQHQYYELSGTMTGTA